MSKHWKALIVVGLVALIALAGTGVALAQGPKGGGHAQVWGRTHLGNAAMEAVAEELGMTADELTTQLQGGAVLADLADKAGVDLQNLRDAATAAQEQAQREAIEQAVTDGKLTRERADWMLQGLERGYGARGGFLGRGGFGFGNDLSKDNTEWEAAAQVLKMSADQLSTQLWGGRTLAQLAEKAGVELEDVQAAMETAREAARRTAIEQAVADGRLTREQADWLLQGLEKDYLGRGGGVVPGGRGSGEMRGMRRGTEAPAPSTSGDGLQAPTRSTGQSI